MRALFATLAFFLFAAPATAELRVSLGVRGTHEALSGGDSGSESQALLAGPALEANFGQWSGELFTESDGAREHFHLELRYPVRPSVALIGGTRADRLELGSRELEYDGDALFAGLRIHLENEGLAPFASVRLFRGSAEVETTRARKISAVHGYAAEAGLLIELWRMRSGILEIVPVLEYERLKSDLVELESARVGARIRYTIKGK